MMFTVDSEEVPVETAHIPGTGGSLKNRTADFRVEEIPLYEPSGDGEHVYVKVQNHEWTTRKLQKEIADLFDLPNYRVGYAGLKDKEAQTTQFLSIHEHDLDPEEAGRTIEDQLGWEVPLAKRHKNKLRAGHLIGNRFEIRLRNPETNRKETRERMEQVAEYYSEHWFPNYYGPQRTGNDGRNMRGGRAIVRGNLEKDRQWVREMYLSAYQSGLFNTWLCRRNENDVLYRLLEGDIAKKRDTGGLFEVEDLKQEQPRMDDRDIVHTGPIYGSDLWSATGEAGAIESRLAREEDLSTERLSELQLPGSRRRGLLHLDDLEYEMKEDGVVFRFSLPKGTYATMVLREFMQPEPENG